MNSRLIVLPPLRKCAAQESALLDVAWLCENCSTSFNVARDDEGRVQIAGTRVRLVTRVDLAYPDSPVLVEIN